MATQLCCNGYDEFKKLIAEHESDMVFVLFTGAVDALEQESWCPDCVTADPVIESKMSEIPADAFFVLCAVGSCAFWKDRQNPFRTDPQLKLKCVPTLMQFGTAKRLEEGNCANGDMVSMLFTDE